MRTRFQHAGAGRILAGAGVFVLTATLCGCLSGADKNKIKPTSVGTNANAAANGTNGQPGAMNQRTNLGQNQSQFGNTGSNLNNGANPGAGLNPNTGLNPNAGLNPNLTNQNRTSGSPGDPNNRFNMNSGPTGPTSMGGAPKQFDQGPSGLGNPGLPIASNSNTGNIRQASANGAPPVNLTNIQPDPTPGMPAPVVMQPGDKQIKPSFQKPAPPLMDGPGDLGIQPVVPGNRQ